MGWAIALTEAAEADLGQAVAFLAQRSPPAAERIGLELLEVIRIWDNRRDPSRLRLG